MSKQNVRLFYDALAENAVLQLRFRERSGSLSGKFKEDRLDDERMEELFLEEILPIVREAGFEFSFQDLKAYAAESKKTGELSDEELTAVAGGGECSCVQVGAGTA